MKNYYGSSSLFYFLPYSFRKFGGRIALNGRANCSHTQLRQLADFAPTRVLSERWQIYMLNIQKRHHGHGMRAFACVVGAKGLQALSMVDMNFTTTPILCSSLKKHIEIFGK